jgi:hypothetical protein
VPITEWQALRIDDDDFDHDSERLIKTLERRLTGGASKQTIVISPESSAPAPSSTAAAGTSHAASARTARMLPGSIS